MRYGLFSPMSFLAHAQKVRLFRSQFLPAHSMTRVSLAAMEISKMNSRDISKSVMMVAQVHEE